MTDRGVNKRLFRQIDEQANEQSINKQRIFKRSKLHGRFRLKNYATLTTFENHLFVTKPKLQSYTIMLFS